MVSPLSKHDRERFKRNDWPVLGYMENAGGWKILNLISFQITWKGL